MSAEEQKQANAPVAIVVDPKTQMMVARDNSELIRMIRTFMKGMAFPKTLDTEEKIIAAWQVAASLKIPPAVAMQNMAVINGSVSIWGQLPKALAEATGEMQDFRQFFIDKDYNEICVKNKNLNVEAWAAVVQIRRKGRSTNEYFFSLDDAKAAGLDKKSGPWRDYRKVMLARRTIGMAIKFEFPDALMGVAIAEYDLHEAPDLKDVTPKAPAKSDVGNQFWEELRGGEREVGTGVVENDTAQRSETVSGPTGHQDRDAEADSDKL